MGRLLQTKVTTLVKPVRGIHHVEANINDRQTQEDCKCNRDKTRRAVTHTICPGDKVLIKQQKTGLKPPFNPKSYTVIEVKGTHVTAIRGSKRKVRNMAKCKLLHRQPKNLVKNITENPSSDELTDSDTLDLTLRQQPRNPHMADHDTLHKERFQKI